MQVETGCLQVLLEAADALECIDHVLRGVALLADGLELVLAATADAEQTALGSTRAGEGETTSTRSARAWVLRCCRTRALTTSPGITPGTMTTKRPRLLLVSVTFPTPSPRFVKSSIFSSTSS